MLRALIFDFDGIILDTEVPIYESWREDYLFHGHDLALETYSACVGSNHGQFDPKAHLEDLAQRKIDWARHDALRDERAITRTNTLEPMPGILDLLDEATSLGIPCAVASSSPRSWVHGHLTRLELFDRFSAIRCLEDVAAPKPFPDLFHAAREALGSASHQTIILEDSRNGLLAALAAGIPCVAVPNRITRHLDFAGAVAMLPSLERVTIGHLTDYL